MQLALGLVETKGLIGSIEAADAMLKAANVKLIGKEIVTGGMVAIKIVGDVAAVKSSVDAGAAAAQRVGQLVSIHVIPRPDDQLESILYSNSKSSGKRKKNKRKAVEKEQSEDLFSAVEEKQVEPDLEDEEPTATDVKVAEEPESVEYNLAVETPEVAAETEEDSMSEDLGDEEKEPETVTEQTENSTIEPKSEKVVDDEIDHNDENKTIPPLQELEEMNVHQLRHLARQFSDFPIKGREISRANRQALIDLFEELRK